MVTKKRWRIRKATLLYVAGGLIAVIFHTYLALFEFDTRSLSGFHSLCSFSGDAMFMSTDPLLAEDQITEILISNRNTVIEAEPGGKITSSISTSGPTIFRFKSGRVRLSHGAYVIGSKEDYEVYAQ